MHSERGTPSFQLAGSRWQQTAVRPARSLSVPLGVNLNAYVLCCLLEQDEAGIAASDILRAKIAKTSSEGPPVLSTVCLQGGLSGKTELVPQGCSTSESESECTTGGLTNSLVVALEDPGEDKTIVRDFAS